MKNPHRSPATIAVSQWGREERSLEDKQETDFFIEALRKRNTGQRGWHQADDVVGLMRGYLRAVEDAYRACAVTPGARLVPGLRDTAPDEQVE